MGTWEFLWNTKSRRRRQFGRQRSIPGACKGRQEVSPEVQALWVQPKCKAQLEWRLESGYREGRGGKRGASSNACEEGWCMLSPEVRHSSEPPDLRNVLFSFLLSAQWVFSCWNTPVCGIIAETEQGRARQTGGSNVPWSHLIQNTVQWVTEMQWELIHISTWSLWK